MLIFNERTHTLIAKLLYVPVNVTSTTPTFCNPTPIYDAALDLQLCLPYTNGPSKFHSVEYRAKFFPNNVLTSFRDNHFHTRLLPHSNNTRIFYLYIHILRGKNYDRNTRVPLRTLRCTHVKIYRGGTRQ